MHDERFITHEELLGKHFTVYNYDRRGRSASSDTQPFAKEREMEDLQALVEGAGGKAMVFGFSSGGVVSLDAAAVIPGMTKVGVMEQDQATWSGMTGVAHTLAYDAAFVGTVMQGKPLPPDRWVKATVPVLVVDGGASDAWIHHGADALANVLPHASRHTLAGQTHMVDPNVLAPVIIEFFQQ